MNAERVQQLRQRLEPLLGQLAAETGLVLTMGKITYTANNAVFAIEAAQRGVGGIPMGRAAESFVAGAARFGLDPTDLGRDFQARDGWYRIVGLNPRSKHPVICQRIDPPAPHLTRFDVPSIRYFMETLGFRNRASPLARIRVEVAADAANDDEG